MRISDWSSDVCSSDLVVRLDAETVERPGQEVEEGLAADFDALDLAAPAVGRLRDDIFDAVDRLRIAVGEDEALHLAVEAREIEIGRASCRESVCQYV